MHICIRYMHIHIFTAYLRMLVCNMTMFHNLILRIKTVIDTFENRLTTNHHCMNIQHYLLILSDVCYGFETNIWYSDRKNPIFVLLIRRRKTELIFIHDVCMPFRLLNARFFDYNNLNTVLL